ncbi:MAG: CAP domain-containing protein [Minisyncoccia bacterium]
MSSFTPEGHVEEGHRSPARHAFGLPGLIVFGVLILGSFSFVAFHTRILSETNQLAAVVTATLVDLANGDRRAAEIGTLTVNPLLVLAAQAKANDMAENSYFAHTSPLGRDSWSWFADAGYLFSYAGENLAVNFSDSKDVEDAWMDSPSHRANILNGRFTEIGIATAVGEYNGKKTTFVVQMFGTPARAAAPTQEPITIIAPASPEDIAIVTTEPGPIVLATNEETFAEAAATSAPEAVGAVESESATGLLASAPRYASLLDFLASSPEVLLRSIYIVCTLLIIGALTFATELEFKRHHVKHVIVSLVLIALMGGLLVAADRFVFTAPLVG